MKIVFHTPDGATSPTSFSDNGVALKIGNITALFMFITMVNFFAPYMFNFTQFTAMVPTKPVWVGIVLNIVAMVIGCANNHYAQKMLIPHSWCDVSLLHRFMNIKMFSIVLLIVTTILMIFGDLLWFGLLC